MKIKKILFLFSLILFFTNINVSAEEFKWHFINTGGNFDSVEELCESVGGTPSYPLKGPGGWYGCWGVCRGGSSAQCYYRGGDSCASGKQYNETLGRCEDSDPPPKDPGVRYTPNDDCPSGVWDNETNDCVPLQPCPEGEVRDEETNKCVPKKQDCPDGQVKDESGQCVPEPEECPDGQVKNEKGQCVPEPCPEGQVRGESGSCEPECPSGGKKDKATGICEPECLSGVDNTGQCNPEQKPTGCDNGLVGNPIVISTGQKVELVTDLAIANSALSFERNYWSTRLIASSIGLGWQHNWRMHIQQLTYKNQVKLYRNDGRGLTFTPLANGKWQSPLASNIYMESLPTGGWKVLENSNVEIYNNKGQLISYSAVGYSAISLVYNNIGQLISLSDNASNSLTINYDERGLITQVSTNQGLVISYDYDEKYRLVGVTKYGKTKQYHYENTSYPNALTGITDERGVRYVTWEYNDKGQAISSENAGGANKYQLEFLDNDRTRVINPLGGSTIYHFKNFLFKREIVRVEGEAIGTCIATNATYNRDYQGLITSKTNKNGGTTSYEYNDRSLETTRKFSGKSLKYNVYTKWHDILPLPIEVSHNGQMQTFKYDNEGKLIEYINGIVTPANINVGKDVVLLMLDDLEDVTGTIWQLKGAATFDGLEPKIGKASLLLDGNGSWIETVGKNDYVLGSENFTIEAWVKTSTTNGNDRLVVDYFTSGKPSWQLLVNSTGHPALYFQGGKYLTANVSVTDGEWHHIAVTREDNNFTIFVDKEVAGEITNNYNFSYKTPLLAIGAQAASRNNKYDFIGNIDQVRLTKGFARSVSDFIAEPYHLYDGNNNSNKGKDIVLLVLDDLSDLANNIWQLNGAATFDSLDSKVGNASLFLDGNNAWIETVSTDDFVLGTSDFTIEAWVKTSTTNGNDRLIVDYFMSGKPSWQLLINSTGHPALYFQGGKYLTANVSVTDGKWHHIAVIREGSNFAIYVDKLIAGETTNNYSFSYQTPIIAVGAQVADRNNKYDFIGHIDQIRITKGLARYLKDFMSEPYKINDSEDMSE